MNKVTAEKEDILSCGLALLMGQVRILYDLPNA